MTSPALPTDAPLRARGETLRVVVASVTGRQASYRAALAVQRDLVACGVDCDVETCDGNWDIDGLPAHREVVHFDGPALTLLGGRRVVIVAHGRLAVTGFPTGPHDLLFIPPPDTPHTRAVAQGLGITPGWHPGDCDGRRAHVLEVSPTLSWCLHDHTAASRR